MSRNRPRRKDAPPLAAPAAARAPHPHRQLELAIWAGLIVAVIAVYAQVGHYFFVTFDDPAYVTENFHVRAGLTLENIKWAFTTVVDSNWVPMTILSHMAVCDWFGMDSGAHHWVNVLLHALSTVLLFAALRRATRALWPSAFVALIFAVHPLHVESVAWISERKDVLSTFFWFLALYAYVRYTELPSLRRYLLVMAPFCLGLMSKPMLVTFPFTLLLLDVWPFRRMQLPRTLWEKIPFFALSIGSSVATYFAQKSRGSVQALPWGENIRNASISYVAYIGQMFWPTGLAVFYPHRDSLAWWRAGGALAIILAISALAVLAWRTRPYLATGWFWYLGTLVPVIGFVQVGLQSHADRYMYVPMVGLSIVLAWGAADAIKRWPRARGGIISAAATGCLACLLVASAQAEYWRNTEALYERAISVTHDNFLAQYSLADYLVELPGRGPDAVSHFEAALRINPDSANAHNGIGGYLLQTGHDAEAEAQFEAALRVKPDLAAAHFNLGVIFSKTPDRVPDAIAHYQAALRAQPDFERAHRNLGVLLLRLGRTAEAISQFQSALRIQDDPEIREIMKALVTGHQ